MDRTNFDPGPLAEVRSRQNDDRWTLVFTRDLRHPPRKVWAALTDPAHLREWAPFTADRDLGTRGAVTLTMIDGDTPQEMAASVTRAERPTLLEYVWGNDVLRWELTAITAGTRLELQHTSPDHADLPRYAAGWHLCLVVAERLLDGQPIAPIVGDAAKDFGWDELNAAYAERLGVTVP